MRKSGLVVVSALLMCCTSAALGEGEEDAIRSLRLQSNDAIARHDAKAVGSFIADDC